MIAIKLLSVILVGYLLGSIPFGLILSRKFARVDIRAHGSGKMGATNVLRTLGRLPAVLTLAGDVRQGYAAVSPAGPDPTTAAFFPVAGREGSS